MNIDEPEYIPGICNIGPAEIAVRKRISSIGLALLLCSGRCSPSSVSGDLGACFFFSLHNSAVGFIQGAMHFSAAYGLRSVFNVASEVGKTDSVLQAEFRTKDKQKARQILGYSFIGGLLVVLVAYLLM